MSFFPTNITHICGYKLYSTEAIEMIEHNGIFISQNYGIYYCAECDCFCNATAVYGLGSRTPVEYMFDYFKEPPTKFREKYAEDIEEVTYKTKW